MELFKRFLSAACALLMASGCLPAAAAVCLPSDVNGVATPASAVGQKRARIVKTYIDGSASMAGYARATTQSLRPHGDFLAVVERFAANRKAPAAYYRFGKGIAPIDAQAARAFATPAPYLCKKCDNQESRIDAILKLAQQAPTNQLTLVITDMWLSDKAFAGSAQVALGGPLTDILRQGKSVGVIGIRAPYTGPIVDLVSRYAGASERPLFVLAIGSEVEVGAFYAALRQSGSPSFKPDRLRYSLFSAASANPWRTRFPLVPAGVGVNQTTVQPALMTAGFQQFRFKRSKGGRIEAEVDAAKGSAPGSVWSGRLVGSTKVWLLKDSGGLKRCTSSTWQPYAPLRGAWRTVPGRPTQARFSLSGASGAGLVPGKTYLIVGYLGAATLASPNPADAWMREWSFSEGQEKALVARRPGFFPALHLGDLASILEAAVDRSKPASGRTQAATAFLVKVER